MKGCGVAEGPTYRDIEAAAARLNGVAVRTPLLEAALLNEVVGARVLVKAEMLQKTGAFKLRGAWNRLSQLSDDEKSRGGVVLLVGQSRSGGGSVRDIGEHHGHGCDAVDRTNIKDCTVPRFWR